ncbi:MAG TPA: PilZ domain-containing protein [Candidatus Didemnitutus sp.]|nr:PilZ domain-containing protein [Candidatus Didemnitutus sp.]
MTLPGKKPAGGPEQRKHSRYQINPTFPIKTLLSLRDKNVKLSAAPHGRVALRVPGAGWKDWPGTLVDLSATGANIHVNLAAVAFADDPCRMKFSLGSYHIEIPASVVHFVSYSHYAVCGVQFNFPDAETERSFMQVLEPVIIGTSLAPVDPAQEGLAPGREMYAGKNSSRLVITRSPTGGELTGFDFRLNKYGVKWSSGMTELRTYGVPAETSDPAKAKPVLKLKLKTNEKPEVSATGLLTEVQEEEARWLFCLAVSNLAPAVAEDVRKFLLSLVVA